jgi:hypothetical protein
MRESQDPFQLTTRKCIAREERGNCDDDAKRTKVALGVRGHARLDHPPLLESVAAYGHLFLRLALLGLARGLRFRLRFWFWFWFGLAIFHLDVGVWR